MIGLTVSRSQALSLNLTRIGSRSRALFHWLSGSFALALNLALIGSRSQALFHWLPCSRSQPCSDRVSWLLICLFGPKTGSTVHRHTSRGAGICRATCSSSTTTSGGRRSSNSSELLKGEHSARCVPSAPLLSYCLTVASALTV